MKINDVKKILYQNNKRLLEFIIAYLLPIAPAQLKLLSEENDSLKKEVEILTEKICTDEEIETAIDDTVNILNEVTDNEVQREINSTIAAINARTYYISDSSVQEQVNQALDILNNNQAIETDEEISQAIEDTLLLL